MKFLVDECTGPAVAKWLTQRGHDAVSVYDEARGETDDWVLTTALKQERIIITNDKDFGEMLSRSSKAHSGVILLRLANESAANKITVLQQVLTQLKSPIMNHFVVATENKIRISKFP